MKSNNKTGINWADKEQVREYHRRYSAKHNKINYAKNPDYWRDYYLKHKDKHMELNEKRKGNYVYYMTEFHTLDTVSKVGSTNNMYNRMARHKTKEMIKYYKDNNIDYFIAYVNLDWLKENITKDDRLCVEQYIQDLYLNKFTEDNPSARERKKYDKLRAQELILKIILSEVGFKIYYSSIETDIERLLHREYEKLYTLFYNNISKEELKIIEKKVCGNYD